jgi:hypothetical protein
MVKDACASKVMLALDSVIGDCATLRLTNETYKTISQGPGGQFKMLVSADIGYYKEKKGCKNDCCWQDLKKMIDSGQQYDVGYTAARTEEPQWEPAAPGNPGGLVGTAYVNPDYAPFLWEVAKGGWLYSAPPPFSVIVWHELVGHGLYGYQHSPEAGNWLNPESPYYDPSIRVENAARHCLGLHERLHQYYYTQKPGEGKLLPYLSAPPPPPPPSPFPSIGAAE